LFHRIETHKAHELCDTALGLLIPFGLADIRDIRRLDHFQRGTIQLS
jgi:hypothetical protein